MPLRDHFRLAPPDRSWDEVHSMWIATMVRDLNRRLPDRYLAAAQVHLGGTVEVDVGTFDRGGYAAPFGGDPAGGGVATAIMAPPEPTVAVTTDLPDLDEYAVHIHDMKRGRRLVAAVEVVSPANEDRPASRRAFVAKCGAMLLDGVCVAIVDLVTDCSANLYVDLLEFFGVADPSLGEEPAATYAVACRWLRRRPAGKLEAWHYPLDVGSRLPELPLWLDQETWLRLDLEATYEQTCRDIRLP